MNLRSTNFTNASRAATLKLTHNNMSMMLSASVENEVNEILKEVIPVEKDYIVELIHQGIKFDENEDMFKTIRAYSPTFNLKMLASTPQNLDKYRQFLTSKR